jgi:hypothetical protein
MDRKRRNEKIDKLEQGMPGQYLKYPNIDPSANEMLVKYTIWKDIKVFSTFFHEFEKKKETFSQIQEGIIPIPIR